jgi:hypothetical protein
MRPALYDLLIDDKAEFGYGAHDPAFATRNGRRNSVDNVRRTFASILAELNLPPRRAMYLIGHTDPTLTMRVYQQVIDMGEGGLQTLDKLIGCTLDEAFALLSRRGVWQPIGNGPTKMPPSPVRGASWKARKRRSCRTFFEAAEGTRTLDLLHVKQT